MMVESKITNSTIASNNIEKPKSTIIKKSDNSNEELLVLLSQAASQLGIACPNPNLDKHLETPFNWVAKYCRPLILERTSSLKNKHLTNTASAIIIFLPKQLKEKYDTSFALVDLKPSDSSKKLKLITSNQEQFEIKTSQALGKPCLILSPQSINKDSANLLGFIDSFKANGFSLAIAALMVNLASLAIPFFISLYFDLIIPNQASASLITLTVGIAIVLLFDWLFKFARSEVSEMRAVEYEQNFYSNIFTNLFQKKSISYGYGKDKLRNLPTAMSGLLDANNSKFILPLYDILFSGLFLFAIFLLGGSLVFVSLAFFAVAGIYAFINAKKSFRLDLIRREKYGQQRLVYNSIVSSFEAVSSRDVQFMMQNNLEYASRQAAQANSIQRKHLNEVQAFYNSIIQGQTLVILLFGFFLVTANELTSGNLFAVMLLCGRLGQSFMGSYSLLSVYYKFKNSKSVGKELLSSDKEISDNQVFTIKKGNITSNQMMLTINGNVVLKAIDLDIKHGEKIAIIGPSGSGKTFLIKILAGLHSPTSGQLLYDAIDKDLYHPVALSGSINYVARTPFIIKGSIYINLTADVNRRLDLNHPAIKYLGQFARKLPKQYNTIVGGQEQVLSYSEMKGISIARSLLGNKKIVLLDEPDQGLDENWQQLFLNTISAVQNTTLIATVTHKKLLKSFDKVIILEKGKIVHCFNVKDKLNQDIINKYE